MQKIDAARFNRDSGIVAAWNKADQTVTQIAKVHGVSRDTVYRALRAAGLDTTPRAVADLAPATRADVAELRARIEQLEARPYQPFPATAPHTYYIPAQPATTTMWPQTFEVKL